VRRGDRWLLLLALGLAAVGLIMVYSSSAVLGITRYQDPNHFLSRQTIRILLGVVVLVACAKVKLRRLERAAPWLLGAAVGLLAVLEVAGHISHGAERWLRLGFLSIQPTDLARLATVVFLAWWLKRSPPATQGFLPAIGPPLAVTGVVAGLILLQPNLSSAALLGMTGILMVFLAGARIRHLAIPVAAAGAAVVLALVTHPYMMGRVQTFVGTWFGGAIDPHGSGWQLDQSLIAIGSGGWLGRGLGGGLQKYLFLPEAHTDFIFSILAEELGFLGATVLLALFGLLLWRGMRVAARANDGFLSLLSAGITLQFGLYAIMNLAVATGLAPTTGLPLPLVSYGGSALLANLAAAGVLYRISGMNAEGEALARQRWKKKEATA
jgi:cell division protein FtsW